MKMLVLACLGATAAAIPFQQSSSAEADVLREFDALLVQQSERDLLLDAYAAAQADHDSLTANVTDYTAAHTMYQRAARQQLRGDDLRARQRDLEQQIEALRLEWRKLERSRELMDTRAQLETLEARQQLRHDQRERTRALEMASRDLEAEAVAVDQQADEVRAELERHLTVELARVEVENADALAVLTGEMLDRQRMQRAAADEKIRMIHEQLEKANAAEQMQKAREILQALDTLTTKVETERESGEHDAEVEIDQIRAQFEAECRDREERAEAEIRDQHMQSRRHLLEIEMQRRDIESRQEELHEQNDFAEERLVLERELVQRERELAMETEMEHMQMLMERLERELERTSDRADEDDGDEDDGLIGRLLYDETITEAITENLRNFDAPKTRNVSDTDKRFQIVMEAIDGLRSDVDGLRRDVDKLIKRAESVR